MKNQIIALFYLHFYLCNNNQPQYPNQMHFCYTDHLNFKLTSHFLSWFRETNKVASWSVRNNFLYKNVLWVLIRTIYWVPRKYVFKENCRTLFSNYRNVPKFSDRQIWANRADPDQTALRGAVWSGSALFAIPNRADPDQTALRGAVWSGSALFAIPSALFGFITLW